MQCSNDSNHSTRLFFGQNAAALRKDGRISELNYDYFTKPIQKDDTDGEWEPSKPVDPATGLWYDPELFSNNSNSSAANKQVPDWYDLLQLYVEHGYDKSLRGSTAKDHPLLVTERAYNPPATRQLTMECLFEELQVPATFLAKEAVLSCYASGRTSATVIDFGYSGTSVVPVFDGYVEPKGIRRNPGASLLAVDELILQHLDQLYYRKKKQKSMSTVLPLYQVRTGKLRKQSIHTAARLQIACDCREESAGASINTAPAGTASTTFHAPSKPFDLPDGTIIDVPSAERFRAADLLYGNDPTSQQAREARLEEVKGTIAKYIDAATASAENAETGDDSKELAKEAVGILKGRPKRGRRQQPPTATKRRSAAALQRACSAHLQTLMDDQLTAAPVAQMVCDAAYRCDRDQQAVLLGNVIVGGGGACFGPTEQAVPEQIKESIEAIIHQHTPAWRVKVLTPSVSERAVLPWIGGSILASLGTFHEMWITKEEYEEWGPAIVNRKCP